MKGLFILVAMTAMIAWGSVLLLGDPATWIRHLRDAERSLSESLPGGAGFLFPDAASPSHPVGQLGIACSLVALHLRGTLALLPVALLLLGAGLSAGLAGREGLRSGARFASPLRAWLGKRTALLGLGCSVVFALTPILLPWWALWVGVLVMAGGTGVYVSNLPLKL